MKFKVLPLDKIVSSFILPASKSYSIRAVFIAACGGVSRLDGLSDCEDVLAAMNAVQAFGANIEKISSGVKITEACESVSQKCVKIDVDESGTSLRFILPLLPFYTRSACVKGRGTLVGRPNRHLMETLRSCGLRISGQGAEESVPVVFDGGVFDGGRVSIDGSVSSQFVSALLIALPRSSADTRLVITGEDPVSRDYVTMTEKILERAGIRLIRRSGREVAVPGNQVFRGLGTFKVPSDYGLAAFPMAAAALLSSNVRLKGCFDDSLIQADGAVFDLFSRMGVKYVKTKNSVQIKGPFKLRGGSFSLKNAPDLVPIMAVLALFATGVTRLRDIGHARVKESDRISDLRAELLKIGADVVEKPDELIIRPRSAYRTNVELDPHKDHRLAMAFSVLGLKIGVTVRDIGCTAKSYPGFVRDFRILCGKDSDVLAENNSG